MNVLEFFSTKNFTPKCRLEYWNHLTAETSPVTTVDCRNDTFSAEMTRWKLGELTLLRPHSSSAVVVRERTRSVRENISLHMQHQGTSRFHHRGVTQEMRSGDFVLLTDGSPYRLELASHEFLIVEMPRSILENRIGSLDDRIARCYSRDTLGAQLLHNFFMTLWQFAGVQSAPDGQRENLGEFTMDLIGLATSDEGSHKESCRSLSDRARRVVQINLADMSFGPTELAREIGVSIRTVQNIFAAMGTTPSGYINSRRLDRAEEMLRSDLDKSITNIAFSAGFSDSNYFGRCFRRRHGLSPREWRRSE